MSSLWRWVTFLVWANDNTLVGRSCHASHGLWQTNIEQLVSVSFCPPQICNGLPWHWALTWTSGKWKANTTQFIQNRLSVAGTPGTHARFASLSGQTEIFLIPRWTTGKWGKSQRLIYRYFVSCISTFLSMSSPVSILEHESCWYNWLYWMNEPDS